jgi:hypothetical protein
MNSQVSIPEMCNKTGYSNYSLPNIPEPPKQTLNNLVIQRRTSHNLSFPSPLSPSHAFGIHPLTIYETLETRAASNRNFPTTQTLDARPILPGKVDPKLSL